jgi:hypothetical protein
MEWDTTSDSGTDTPGQVMLRQPRRLSQASDGFAYAGPLLQRDGKLEPQPVTFGAVLDEGLVLPFKNKPAVADIVAD